MSGITYEVVAEAANSLSLTGATPTIEKIRLQLGSGSNTTIHKHLNRWREEQQQDMKDNASSAPPDIIKFATEQAWLAIQKEAEAKMAFIQEEARERVSAAEEKAQCAMKKSASLEKELAQLREDYHNVCAEKELLGLDSKKWQHDYALMSETNRQLEVRLRDAKAMSQFHTQQLVQAHEQAIEQFQQQLFRQETQAKASIDEIKMHAESYRQETIVTIDQLKTENKNLNHSMEQKAENLKQKEIKLAALQVELLAQKANEQLAKEVEATTTLFETIISEHKRQLDTLAKQIAHESKLTDALDGFKSEMQNKITKLMHVLCEKNKLIQEKNKAEVNEAHG